MNLLECSLKYNLNITITREFKGTRIKAIDPKHNWAFTKQYTDEDMHFLTRKSVRVEQLIIRDILWARTVDFAEQEPK